MDAKTVHVGFEVRESVQPFLLGTPVEAPPVVEEAMEVRRTRSKGPVVILVGSGPARSLEALAEIIEGRLRDMN